MKKLLQTIKDIRRIRKCKTELTFEKRDEHGYCIGSVTYKADKVWSADELIQNHKLGWVVTEKDW
jgi:hypothetical protein